jgi:hypothetical protein
MAPYSYILGRNVVVVPLTDRDCSILLYLIYLNRVKLIQLLVKMVTKSLAPQQRQICLRLMLLFTFKACVLFQFCVSSAFSF